MPLGPNASTDVMRTRKSLKLLSRIYFLMLASTGHALDGSRWLAHTLGMMRVGLRSGRGAQATPTPAYG
jgi:hypothetical protein